jgi:hypothetical protein
MPKARRPAGVHGLRLIDDLTAEAAERMKAERFEPAVVVATSLNNFQAPGPRIADEHAPHDSRQQFTRDNGLTSIGENRFERNALGERRADPG